MEPGSKPTPTAADLLRREQEAGLERQAALAASEEKFSRIFRLSPNAISLAGLEDGVIFDCNENFARFLGYPGEAVIGRSTLPGDLGLWASLEDRDRYVARLKADGEVLECELLLCRKDGSTFPGLISSSLLEIGGKNCILTIVRDITQRKQAEAALIQERTFTDALLENLVEGVVACDDKGQLVMFNRTLREWHGLDGHQMLKRAWAAREELFEPDGTTRLATQALPLLRSLGGEVLHAVPMVIRAQHQHPRQVLADSAPIVDGSGRRLGAVMVMHDVTKQQHLDEVVRKISVAVEQGPVTIVITDTEARIEYVNPKFTELTGYTPDEVLGRNPRIMQSGLMPAGVYADLWAAIGAGRTWKGEFHNRKKNGELFWESATIAPIKDAAGVITNFVAIKEDITGRKRAENQLQQLNEELEERIRQRTALLELANTELDAFSYSVSHDLRTPLRGIDGFSQALVEECGDQLSPAAKHYLQRVRAGTQRMGQQIDDLLKLSRVSRTKLNRQRLDLSALAAALVEEIRQGDPGRNLEFRLEPGLVASGDQGLVRSVLQNLLGNAWKYTAKVPAVRIELFRAVQPDGSEAFCVKDNGAGFDMAYAGKLFAPFQRLHSTHDFEGSGIGLAIVQRIIRRHGGQVWATGEVDRGASFFFTLPEQP